MRESRTRSITKTLSLSTSKTLRKDLVVEASAKCTDLIGLGLSSLFVWPTYSLSRLGLHVPEHISEQRHPSSLRVILDIVLLRHPLAKLLSQMTKAI